jgi:hypothetical protein
VTIWTHAERCPECEQGKHVNCTVDTLTDEDEWVPCRCMLDGHVPPTCDKPEGCCTCCDGAGQDVGCAGMCWDCRGTGHPHELS